MKYPVLGEWIKFEKINEDSYLVDNYAFDDVFELPAEYVEFALKLDGKTDPHKVDSRYSRRQVREILSTLETFQVIRDKRFLSKSIFSVMVTLWRPRMSDGLRTFSYIINSLLMISWLPVLLLSGYHFTEVLPDMSSDGIILGTIAGLLLGVFMHEMGHMLASLAYGGTVYEVGAMMWFLLPGAYVLLDERNIKNRMQRAQIYAAGVEMNFLISGISIFLGTELEEWSGFFFIIAINNIIMGCLNLVFVNGFDGAAVMGELLGINRLGNTAKEVLKSRRKKRTLKKNGLVGKATLATCYLVRLMQIAFPLVMILNVLEVISWLK